MFYLYSFFLLCKLFLFSIFFKNGSFCAAFHIVWLVISLAGFLQSHLVNFLHMSWKIILPCTSISTSWTLERSPPVMCSQVQIQSKPLKRNIKHRCTVLIWPCLKLLGTRSMRTRKLEYSRVSIFTFVHLILPPVALATHRADIQPLSWVGYG